MQGKPRVSSVPEQGCWEEAELSFREEAVGEALRLGQEGRGGRQQLCDETWLRSEASHARRRAALHEPFSCATSGFAPRSHIKFARGQRPRADDSVKSVPKQLQTTHAEGAHSIAYQKSTRQQRQVTELAVNDLTLVVHSEHMMKFSRPVNATSKLESSYTIPRTCEVPADSSLPDPIEHKELARGHLLKGRHKVL